MEGINKALSEQLSENTAASRIALPLFHDANKVTEPPAQTFFFPAIQRKIEKTHFIRVKKNETRQIPIETI